jgi:hypothetical protein
MMNPLFESQKTSRLNREQRRGREDRCGFVAGSSSFAAPTFSGVFV